MAYRGRAAAGCKGRFFGASPTSGLAHADSHGVSARRLSNLINSYPKAALAAFFFGLTNYVIFEDVLRHGATITTDHLLSFGVLLGTFAGGHWFWPTLRQLHIGGALGCAVLLGFGTVYCVVTSAGRNAEALTAKAAKVTADDGPRAALAKRVEDAKAEREKADKAVETAEAETRSTDDKKAQVCGKYGVGNWRCDAETVKVEAAKGREADKRMAVEDKTNTYYMLDARLRSMTKREANGDLKYAAKVISLIVTVSDDTLADLIPFAKSVFCELATLIFAAGAFAHRRGSGSEPEAPAAKPETVPQPAEPSRDRPTATVLRLSTLGTVPPALVLLRQHLAVHGTVPQSDLRALFGDVSKQTVSRWCDEWEAAELIVRETVGRSKVVCLAPPKRPTWRVPRRA